MIGRVATLATAAALALGVAAPASFAATSGGLTITTSYPAIVVAPGASVSFDVNVSTTTPQRSR
jgi:hypothetical protein